MTVPAVPRISSTGNLCGSMTVTAMLCYSPTCHPTETGTDVPSAARYVSLTSDDREAGEASARTISPAKARRVAITFTNGTRGRAKSFLARRQPELNALIVLCHPPPDRSRVDSIRTQSDRRFSPGASTTNR